MDTKEFLFRLGTLEDLDQLVDLHYKSFTPDFHLAMVLGKRFIRRSYHWFLTSENAFVWLAEYNNQVVSMTTISDIPYNRPMLKHSFFAATLGLLGNPGILFHKEIRSRLYRLITGKREVMELQEDSHEIAYLAFIATDSSMRGTGLGSKILNSSEDICLKRNKTFIRAGVYRQNIASIKMFTKVGYKKVENIKNREIDYYQKYISKPQ